MISDAISDTIYDFLQLGVSVILGTANERRIPESLRAFGVRVSADRSTLTIFVPEAGSARTLANLRENGRIAVTLSRPANNRSMQLKGKIQEIRPTLTEAEKAARDDWYREFVAEVVGIGMGEQAMDAVILDPSFAVDIRVESAFDGTPGPTAGARL